MTKNKRKVIALMMAMVMVMASMFAMTTSVFAGTDNTITVNVEFYDGDEELLSWPVEIDPTTMTDADWNALYTIPALQGNQTYHEKLLLNNARPSAMDATMKALQDMGTADGTEVYWDYGKVVDLNSKIEGGYITDIFGLGTVTDTSLTTGSLWVGDAWLYKITGANGEEVPNYYATNVALEDGMTITWTYTYGIEEPMV